MANSKKTLSTLTEIISYVVERGYHRQRNEDGSINFNYIDADLALDEMEGKIVLPADHDRVEDAYGRMAATPLFTSPVAATLTFVELV